MKQLPSDIILYEGNNELNIQMPPIPEAEFVYVSDIRNVGIHYPPFPGGGEYFIIQVDVQNVGEVAGVCTITAWWRSLIVGVWSGWTEVDTHPDWYEYGVRSVSLQPGEIGTLEWWVVNVLQASQEETRVTCEAGTLEARVK
ncbi:hypothetical protein ES703_109058 [subsurface metagenome]